MLNLEGNLTLCFGCFSSCVRRDFVNGSGIGIGNTHRKSLQSDKKCEFMISI